MAGTDGSEHRTDTVPARPPYAPRNLAGRFVSRGRKGTPAVRTMMSGKIHRATVTEANLDYEGSITLDPDLMDEAGILPYEQVHVVDVTNGARLETYAILGERGSGEVCINGAAAHLVHRGDTVIIIAYQQFDEAAAPEVAPRKVFVDTRNRVIRTEIGDGVSHNPRVAAGVAGGG